MPGLYHHALNIVFTIPLEHPMMASPAGITWRINRAVWQTEPEREQTLYWLLSLGLNLVSDFLKKERIDVFEG
jgi:hypothetical protein